MPFDVNPQAYRRQFSVRPYLDDEKSDGEKLPADLNQENQQENQVALSQMLERLTQEDAIAIRESNPL